jgi:hypothetical protein
VSLRVAWLEDQSIFAGRGGAEENDRTVFEEGVRRGHQQVVLHAQTAPPDPRALQEYDVVIVSNASTFTVAYPLALGDAGVPYVLAIKDYWPLCSWRLYFPRMDICKAPCPPNSEHTKRLLSRSVYNVFSSPLHLEAWGFVLPEVTSLSHYLHPSMVDGAVFKSAARKEPATVLAVQSLVGFKGAENALKYAKEHPSLKFTFVGDGEAPFVQQAQALPNAKVLPRLDPGPLADLYAGARTSCTFHRVQSPTGESSPRASSRVAGSS